MHPSSVVEDLDVLEDGCSSVSSSAIDVTTNQFLLECGKEALSYSVVVAIAFGTHALFHSIAPQTASERTTGVLAASVAVEYEPRLRLP